MARGILMLTDHVERYLSLRQTLGYKLRNTLRNLRAFASFAAQRGDTHVRTSTAVAWATRGARARLMKIAVENVRAFLQGKPQNVVN